MRFSNNKNSHITKPPTKQSPEHGRHKKTQSTIRNSVASSVNVNDPSLGAQATALLFAKKRGVKLGSEAICGALQISERHTHTHVHARARTHTYTQADTHVHARTHTHTPSRIMHPPVCVGCWDGIKYPAPFRKRK